MSDIERGGLSVESAIDAKTAFAEAYAAAERKAAEEAGLIDAEGQPRDPDTGQYVSTEQPADEAAPADETAVVEETPADTLLAGKYKTVEELERAYTEAKATIDRQGNELGDLRSAFEERFQELNDRLDQPQQPHRQITPELVEQNPAAATQLAFDQGDQYALSVALEQWKLDDPASAAMWYSTKLHEQARAADREEYEKRLAEVEQRVAPIQQQSADAQFANQIQALPPEVKSFLSDGQAVQQLATEFPTIGNTIVNGAPAERVEAIRALHDIHRGRTADTLTRTSQDVARETAEAAQAARDDAYVASATASQEQPKSPEQIAQEQAVAAFTRRQSTWDDAFVRPAKK